MKYEMTYRQFVEFLESVTKAVPLTTNREKSRTVYSHGPAIFSTDYCEDPSFKTMLVTILDPIQVVRDALDNVTAEMVVNHPSALLEACSDPQYDKAKPYIRTHFRDQHVPYKHAKLLIARSRELHLSAYINSPSLVGS